MAHCLRPLIYIDLVPSYLSKHFVFCIICKIIFYIDFICCFIIFSNSTKQWFEKCCTNTCCGCCCLHISLYQVVVRNIIEISSSHHHHQPKCVYCRTSVLWHGRCYCILESCSGFQFEIKTALEIYVMFYVFSKIAFLLFFFYCHWHLELDEVLCALQ